MKYLVVKGFLGFGDRLESLKMCVYYAQKNNLQIYVDWTDPIWTHGDESFYTYFKLVNMPVLNSLDDIPADATYYPPFWTDKIKNPLTPDLVNKSTELGIFFKLDGTHHQSSDVVVFSCIGWRMLYDDSTFFARSFKVINRDVLDGVKARLANVPSLSTCLGIHARGTDRAKNDTRRERSIQFMALNAMTFASKKMIAVGDDKYSIELWKRFYPDTVVFTHLAQTNSSNKGNHLASKEELKDSKYDLTVEFLVDFFTLAYCERVISTFKDSRFAQEARRLHPCVKQILGNE